jgi:hypothetical protein
MIVQWLKRLLVTLVLAICAALAIQITRTSPEPWTASDIAGFTASLNEAAAIGVPHGFLMKSEMRDAHLTLLEKVESGAVLSEPEDRIYRQVFQTVLHQSQGFLGAFDRELSVLVDHAMPMANNVSGAGISGDHDHHDLSARKNFDELLTSLQKLEAATTSFGRIVHANAAQKDLVDLISHMGVAPHTVSVAYVAPDAPWPDAELGVEFEEMLKNFKAAQFSPINGPDYWIAIDAALQHYANLILAVQHIVQTNTSPWERKVAGRFLSAQTLAPPVDLNRPLRRK